MQIFSNKLSLFNSECLNDLEQDLIFSIVLDEKKKGASFPIEIWTSAWTTSLSLSQLLEVGKVSDTAE